MNYLWLSPNGDTVDLAWRVEKEGNAVKFYIPPQKSSETPELASIDRETGDGIVDKVPAWETHAAWADIVVIDALGECNKFPTGDIADRLRKAGKPVVAAGAAGERLELDRHHGQQILARSGAKVIPTVKFTDFDAAIDYVRANPARYVSKPNVSIESEFTVVAKEDDSSDLVADIERFKSTWPKYAKVAFELQEHVQGVEIDVGGYFNGRDWLRPIWVQFEHKKFAAGDDHNPKGLGFATGEMGSTGFWGGDSNRFFEESIAKCRAYLSKIGVHGWCDINAIVNERGVWPLEWTMRFGIPESYLNGECQDDDWGFILHSIATGQGKSFKHYRGWGCVIQMVAMGFPFPHEVVKHSNSHPIEGITPAVLPHFHPEDCRADKDGRLSVAGTSGVAYAITAKAENLAGAASLAYDRIGPLADSNLWYRTDIGDRNLQDIATLHDYGYDFDHPESRA